MQRNLNTVTARRFSGFYFSPFSCEINYLSTNCNNVFPFQHVKQVLGVEIIDEAVRDAKFNAEANKIENCRFFTGNADDFIMSLMNEPGVAGQDVVAIVDPPRAGLRKL